MNSASFRLMAAVAVMAGASILYGADEPKIAPKELLGLGVKQPSGIKFTAVGKPGFMRISGEGDKVSGSYDQKAGKGQFLFSLDSLITGIDLRDEHMKKKYLETEKFPEAEFDLHSMSPALGEKGSGEFSGKLTLHGVSQAVSGDYDGACEGQTTCEVTAEFSIKLSDFKIDIPSYAGITVAEKVDVIVTLKLKGGK